MTYFVLSVNGVDIFRFRSMTNALKATRRLSRKYSVELRLAQF